MIQKVLALATQKYGLDVARVLPSENGYRNTNYPLLLTDGKTVNLIVYKAEPHILKKITVANKTSDFLASQGFPARRTIGRILQISSARLTKFASLYTYLPGHTIPWEAYTMDHIKLLGKIMSDMHKQLQSAPLIKAPDVTALNLELLARMSSYFDDPNVMAALRLKLNILPDLKIFKKFKRSLNKVAKLEGKQLLHMDFVRGNILFQNEPSGDLKFNISGILDFEKAAYGHPVYDIARTLAFLLVDCKFKQAVKVRKYFLQSGYNKRGASDFSGHDELLESIVDCYLFHDFYKFLKHNPYESLNENEHFMRTRDLLLERKMVK